MSVLLVVATAIALLSVPSVRQKVLVPPSLLWALFDGTYGYDPRTEKPPQGLFANTPEESMKYFLDSTLKLCDGTVARLSKSKIVGYEVEQVNYNGRTGYYAWSDVNVRLHFDDGTTRAEKFNLEAMQSNGNSLLGIFQGGVVQAGTWRSIDLLPDPAAQPPGWGRGNNSTYQEYIGAIPTRAMCK